MNKPPTQAEPIHRTYSVHTAAANIARIDQHAEAMRRSRNSLLNEAIEMLLESYDKAVLEDIDRRWKRVADTAIAAGAKKKAGAR